MHSPLSNTNPAREKEDSMAWRIGENVVRGEIDNRLPGIIKGTLYLDGLNSPVSLELEGNCEPDLAGRHLIFRNLTPRPETNLEGFSPTQCGEVGVMTASSMVRIPTIPAEEVTRRIQEHKPIPTCWSESLRLEWFSDNGRVLIEGTSFACHLSAPKWRLSDETHQWLQRVRDCEHEGVFSDEEQPLEEEDEILEEPTDKPFSARKLNIVLPPTDGCRAHPLAQDAAEFLVRMIFESKYKRIYVEDAIENQPLEMMIESMAAATVRLAHALAKASEWDTSQTVHRLKRAHWALVQASENAGLAKHVGSADPEWLKGIRREFGAMRRELRCLIHEYQEEKPRAASAN
jgi:hypothetical protein